MEVEYTLPPEIQELRTRITILDYPNGKSEYIPEHYSHGMWYSMQTSFLTGIVCKNKEEARSAIKAFYQKKAKELATAPKVTYEEYVHE